MLIPTTLVQDGSGKDVESSESDGNMTRRQLSLAGREIEFSPGPEFVYLPVIEKDAASTKRRGPIGEVVIAWLRQLPSDIVQENHTKVMDELWSTMPKRWSRYQPMILLPARSFQSDEWESLLKTAGEERRDMLWKAILEAVSKMEGGTPLTHIAVNSGIPAQQKQAENILRSPSGLVMLYGDFGPSDYGNGGDEPSEDDFKKALWVSTIQNGIYQTWAPRWTMFSRGNIKEKARLLGFHKGTVSKRRQVAKQNLGKGIAVDLYAGIGYFVFSYAKLGMARVVCWEINPWSVEGLRRGAERNGWDVKIMRGDASVQDTLGASSERIVVFLENNEKATKRMMDSDFTKDEVVRHVNCGFLPSSEATWETAWSFVGKREPGWLHLHENVAIGDIAARRREIDDMFQSWADVDVEGNGRFGEVEHVEMVKSFAPGVWHCVFDVYVSIKQPND